MNKDEYIDLLIKKVMEKLEDSLEEKTSSPEKNLSLNEKSKKNIACVYFSPEQIKIAEQMGDMANFIFRDRIYRNMDVDEVWIGRFSYDDLTKMALGLNTSFGYIMEVIMKGIPVYIFPEGREYINYEDKAPIFLVNMWRSYEKKIYNLGIYFDNPLKKGRNHFQEQDNSFDIGEKYVYGEEGLQGNLCEKHFIDKKLLTENDIQTLPKNTCVIEIPKRTIITPLAQDYLRQRKISCVRKV
ncbi:MAG: hypothetical protein Q4Q07_09060 [Tissierellia bacterium]|nr:hypothetical protein [Tissierellia bacterium]